MLGEMKSDQAAVLKLKNSSKIQSVKLWITLNLLQIQNKRQSRKDMKILWKFKIWASRKIKPSLKKK